MISEDRLLHRAALLTVMATRGGAGEALALALGLPDTELLRDEAVFNHLVDVLFLGERTFVVEVQVAHLLANVWLVNTLRMVSDEPVTY